jgi:hypothetical protein
MIPQKLSARIDAVNSDVEERPFEGRVERADVGGFSPGGRFPRVESGIRRSRPAMRYAES